MQWTGFFQQVELVLGARWADASSRESLELSWHRRKGNRNKVTASLGISAEYNAKNENFIKEKSYVGVGAPRPT